VWCFPWCQRPLNRAKASERYRSQKICIVHGPVQGQLNTCKMNRLRWGLRAVGVPHVQWLWARLVLSNINSDSGRHHSHLSSVVPSFQIKFAPLLNLWVGVGVAGIATRYGLDGPGIDSRGGTRFSAPLQTGPGAHPASYTMGTPYFPGVKQPECGVDHPPHRAPRLKKEYSYISTPPVSAFLVCSKVNFTIYTFTLTLPLLCLISLSTFNFGTIHKR